METKFRLTYDGKSYTFDEHPLDNVDVTVVQTITRTTSKGQEVTLLISPEIPVQVTTFTPGSGRMKVL